MRFNALIAEDGTVRDMSLVSGHPLLVEAAKEAVVQYRYKPTLLDGKPVEAITNIDVRFHL